MVSNADNRLPREVLHPVPHLGQVPFALPHAPSYLLPMRPHQTQGVAQRWWDLLAQASPPVAV